MDKIFIIAQQGPEQANAIAAGLALSQGLHKTAEIFAYSYASFAGKEQYNPRLAAAARISMTKQQRDEISAQLAVLGVSDVPIHSIWTKDLFEHVCHHSVRHGFEMIIKALHPTHHFMPMDWHLIRNVNIPLLLLSDQPEKQTKTVLMAVDLGSDQAQKKRLNQNVIKQATSFAQATDSQLHLAYVIRLPKILKDMDVINTHTLVKDAYNHHQAQFAALGLPKEQIHILVGEPDLCLFELSCRLKATYLVVGTRQRQGLLGYVIGNTAEAILNLSRCHLLVIPDDHK